MSGMVTQPATHTRHHRSCEPTIAPSLCRDNHSLKTHSVKWISFNLLTSNKIPSMVAISLACVQATPPNETTPSTQLGEDCERVPQFFFTQACMVRKLNALA
ncbi:hypothetical protein KC19_6G115500 [Ceratodon purpureus]|uniref:Uncharacterized protein n=1 Tax=Ceratodon purpureus TaxID=3225 RepID=A0A8T0HIS8_CERPU|nr:hypothetical protein KC19_6G115500 [Ceratodon purpureus]